MYRPYSSAPLLAASAALIIVSAGGAATAVAEDYRLEAESTAAPSELSEEVRARLGEKLLRVANGDEVLVELWLVLEPSTAATSEAVLGVEFADLEQGALIGAVRFPNGWADYKETAIAAGVYTLRYGVQPANGDHMGVSEYRDFLLLLLAEDDVDPAAVSDPEVTIDMSRGASRKVHPAVLALFPVWDDVEVPAIVDNEIGQRTLVVDVDGLSVGLVLEGHGEL